jgi:hypothetical protein
MSLVITWSETNGGDPISDVLSHGGQAVGNGDQTIEKTIYIRHNGVNPITSCSLYVNEYSSTYTGTFTPSDDKAELISWGDAGSSGSWGGLMLNMNATGGFPVASWPTFADKTTTDGYGFNVRTGVGDSNGTGVTIPTVTGATSSGTIQAGSSPNVRFQMRFKIPQNLMTPGIRLFDTVLKFSFTS